MFFLTTRGSENTSKRRELKALSASNEKMADEDQESLYECLSGKVPGLRRNGTLKGRNMIKKVPCPIVPTGQSAMHMDKIGPSTAGNTCPRVACRLSTISSTSSSSSSDTAAADMIESWLASIHFDEYIKNFVLNGYDLATASRMSPEDLIAIGITNPQHRKKIKMEINALNVADGIPTAASNLYDWLYKLRLEEYYDLLCHQSYDSIEKVSTLTWEDFEEIGIQKLGHQKRLDLAIKKMNQEQKKNHTPAPCNGGHLVNQSHYASTSTINFYPNSSTSSSVSFPDLTRCPTSESFRPVVLVSSSQTTSMPSHSCQSDGPFMSCVESNQRMKQRPVAMIQAKSRPASTGPSSCGFYSEYGSICEKDADSISNSEVSSISSLSSVSSSSRHNYSGMSDVASIYATLKRNKKPPPPPKRTNSVISSVPSSVSSQFSWQQSCKVVPQPMATNTAFINNSHCKSFMDAVQEAAFATCVKSLASQFSQISQVHDDDRTINSMTNNSKVSLISSDDKFGGSYEFPPPPSPLRHSVEDISSNSTVSENTSVVTVKSPISSSSSNESLPFANDNLGTIRQSASSHSQALMTHAYSNTGSTFANNLRDNSASVVATATTRQTVQSTPTVMDDIETMLANLSNQLDAMLEQEVETN